MGKELEGDSSLSLPGCPDAAFAYNGMVADAAGNLYGGTGTWRADNERYLQVHTVGRSAIIVQNGTGCRFIAEPAALFSNCNHGWRKIWHSQVVGQFENFAPLHWPDNFAAHCR